MFSKQPARRFVSLNGVSVTFAEQVKHFGVWLHASCQAVATTFVKRLQGSCNNISDSSCSAYIIITMKCLCCFLGMFFCFMYFT